MSKVFVCMFVSRGSAKLVWLMDLCFGFQFGDSSVFDVAELGDLAASVVDKLLDEVSDELLDEASRVVASEP